MGLTYSSVVCAEPDEVFAWHSRPGAITRLMPPWQPVRVAREAASVRDRVAVLALPSRDALGEYGHDLGRLRPAPAGSADVLLPPLGAALRWRHTHQFAPARGGGTLVVDVVDTPIPGRALQPMFEYRHRQLAADLAVHARTREVCPEPLTIALTGSERGGRVGPGGAADHRRAPGDPAGTPSAAGRRRARVAAGRPRPGAAGRRRRGDPPRGRLDWRPVHSGAQAGDPVEPDRPDPRAGHAGGPVPRAAARLRHRVRSGLLRRRPRRRDPDRGERARRRIPGRRGRRLGGRGRSRLPRPPGSGPSRSGRASFRPRAAACCACCTRCSRPASAGRSATAPGGCPGSRSTTCSTSTCARSPTRP